MKEKSYFEVLEKEVVEAGKCSGCSACVVACPHDALDYVEEHPVLSGDCTGCGICIESCYRLHPASEAIQQILYHRAIDWEKESFGTYRVIVATQITAAWKSDRYQDGGGASGLLHAAFMSGEVHGALVAGRREDLHVMPLPKLVKYPEELKSCAGTCYTYSPNLLLLKKEKERLPEKLALVGNSCQINAVRQWQARNLKKHAKRIRLTIALFCAECFTPGLLYEKIAAEMRIPLQQISKMDIKGKLLIHLASGEVKELPLKDAKAYARPVCDHCGDFSGIFADLSLGGMGANGWTVTVVRSEMGERILDAAVKTGILAVKPIEEFPLSIDLLNKMSRRQISRIKKTADQLGK